MQFIPGLGLDQVLSELKRLRKGRNGTGGDRPVATQHAPAAQIAEALLTSQFSVGPGAAPRKQEFFVRSSTSWKQVHGRTSSEGTLGRGVGVGGRRSKDIQMRETADILAGCADDMKAIWEDPTVREMLLRKGIRMETTPGLCVAFFFVLCRLLAACSLVYVQLLERY